MEKESPCKTCTIVKDPEICDDKLCKQWREWFMRKWEDLRNGKRKGV